MNKAMFAVLLFVAPMFVIVDSQVVHAQLGGAYPQYQSPAERPPVASLQDYLTTNLRATLPEQKQFIAAVVQQVNLNRLDNSLPIALSRYSLRRNAAFPFPFFERAMRFEAAKRGVSLPAVAVIRSAGIPSSPL